MNTTDPRDAVIQSQTTIVAGLIALSTRNETIAWSQAFPDDDYWVSVIPFDGSAVELDAVRIRGVKSKTASEVVVRISNVSVSQFGINVMLIGIWRPS